GLAEPRAAEMKLHQAKDHAHAGRGEAEMPVHFLAQGAAHQRSESRAEIDAHVEQRESGIPPGAAFGIELAYEDADIWLEQAGADNDQDQAEVKRFVRRDRHREMAGGNNRAAD